MGRLAILAAGLAVVLSTVLGAPARAQGGADLFGLSYLAETDPQAALAQIDALIAEADGSDPRLLFDLVRLKADLTLSAGDTAAAAAQVAELAAFAARNRARLDVDPALLWAESARLFETARDPESARDAVAQLVEEQRDGARAPEVIAESLTWLARLSDQLGQTQEAATARAAAEAALAQDMEGATRGSDGGFREVEVYYATDRARTGTADPSDFYGKGRGDLELGVATVTVPEQHTPGVLEAPSVWRLEFRANPARHVVLASVEPLDPDSFYGRLQSEFRDSPEREAFVFVHGYNVRFDSAARRAAQIAYDMKYSGVPILYSWPSRGTTVGYVADTAVVRLSGRRLARFLDDLVERSGADTIHIVAHSMGNRALTDALELLALRRGLQTGDAPLFGQVLFAAPDVDAGLFREMLPTIRPVAKRLTLYASEGDWALAASRKLHGDVPRAGVGGADTLVDPAIDSIDMSELGEDMLAHSYFADDSSALADMMTLFWQNTAPQHRCGLRARDDAPTDRPVWAYRAGVCANRNLIDVLGHMRNARVTTMDQARIVLDQTVGDGALSRQLEDVVAEIVSPASKN